MSYIEREALKAVFEEDGHLSAYVEEMIDSIPAADVRPVVLCKDCKMATVCSDDREMYCTLNHCYRGKTYFCADGRWKNENHN